MQSLEVPPLMLTQEEFLNEVRKINPLVCLEHCRHLGLQLQVLNFDLMHSVTHFLFSLKFFNCVTYKLKNKYHIKLQM